MLSANNCASISEQISKYRKENRGFLLEPEAKSIMRSIGIDVPRFSFARTAEEAVQSAKEIDYPLVVKIVSPDITHKTDAGGVIVGVRDSKELQIACEKILDDAARKMPGAKIEGLLVEEMVQERGHEVVIGVTRNEKFGPVAMFGLGGVMVELFKDVSFKIIPLNRYDARNMISEIKAFPLFQGFRGAPKVNLELLVEVILCIAGENGLIETYKGAIHELEINPLLVTPDRCIALDGLIKMEKDE